MRSGRGLLFLRTALCYLADVVWGDCIAASCSRLGRHDVHGGEVDAHLEIGGGTNAQTVDEIEITLVSRIRHSVRTGAIRRTTYSGKRDATRRSVEAGVGQTIDVPPQGLLTTPVTLGESEVWI
jgi:sporulation-control protein spo0M